MMKLYAIIGHIIPFSCLQHRLITNLDDFNRKYGNGTDDARNSAGKGFQFESLFWTPIGRAVIYEGHRSSGKTKAECSLEIVESRDFSSVTDASDSAF